jgi:uncharacterized protein
MLTLMRPIHLTGLLAFIGLLGALYMVFGSYTPPQEETTSNSPTDFPVNFHMEIASTSKARERGLSGRADIPENYGMLFVFDASDRYGFWMKDMLVPIDMIWITEDGTIAGIEREVRPDTFPTSFYPPVPVRYVLETRAGEAARLGFATGTRLQIP